MWRRLTVLLVALQLGGCAYIAAVGGHLDQQVDTWVAQQDYGEALAALSYVKPSNPDYKRLMAKRAAIETMARRYARHTVAEADQLARQGNWSRALHDYDVAQSRLPHSDILRRGRAQLEQRQQAQLAELDLNLLIARGEGLQRQLPIYTDIARTNPRDSEAQRKLGTIQKQAADVAAELVQRGRTALAHGALTTARRTLSLALRLTPNADTRQANQELLRRLAPHGTQNTADGNTKQLLQRYRQALNDKDLVEAQRLLSLLELQPSAPPQLSQLRSDLNDRIADVVHRYLDRGVALYGHGKYEEALAEWRKAQELDPENDTVNSHIARAERVLEKLQSLKERQGADTAP